MTAYTYESGHEIVSQFGAPSRVLKDNVEVYRGRDIDCVRWLAQRGDRTAKRELAARKDS